MEHANLMRNEDSLKEGLEKILTIKERVPNVKAPRLDALQPGLARLPGRPLPDPDLGDHHAHGHRAHGTTRGA